MWRFFRFDGSDRGELQGGPVQDQIFYSSTSNSDDEDYVEGEEDKSDDDEEYANEYEDTSDDDDEANEFRTNARNQRRNPSGTSKYGKISELQLQEIAEEAHNLQDDG